MITFRRVLAVIAIVIGILALILALLGGAVMESVMALISLGRISAVDAHPLGAGVLVVYACGIAAGVAALHWPASAGGVLVLLGVCAYLFGGPVAKLYGVVVSCVGLLLLMTRLRRSANSDRPQPRQTN